MKFNHLEVVFIFREASADTVPDQLFVGANPDTLVSVIAHPLALVTVVLQQFRQIPPKALLGLLDACRNRRNLRNQIVIDTSMGELRRFARSSWLHIPPHTLVASRVARWSLLSPYTPTRSVTVGSWTRIILSNLAPGR
jgi:hypothetical protein